MKNWVYGWSNIRLATMFDIPELRSIRAFRVILTLTLLYDLASWALNLSTFIRLLPDECDDECPWVEFAVHCHFTTSEPVQLLLLFLQASLAILTGLGFCSSALAALNFYFIWSLHLRFSDILIGADDVLRLAMLWSVFMGNQKRNEMIDVLPMRIQIVMLYLFTGWTKCGAAWESEGSALWRSMLIEKDVWPLGTILATSLTNFSVFLTFSSLWIERLGPVLLMLPERYFPISRSVGVVLFVGLQVGILCTLRVGIYPLIMQAVICIFIPTYAWDLSAGSGTKQQATTPGTPTGSRHWTILRLLKIVAVCCACVVIVTQGVVENNKAVQKSVSVELAKFVPTSAMDVAGSISSRLCMDQTWQMFSTDAALDRGNTWTVIPANGGTIDLQRGFDTRVEVAFPLKIHPGSLPLDMESVKPAISEFKSWAFYKSHRWAVLLELAADDEDIWVRFVHHICTSWSVVKDVTMVTAHEAVDWGAKSRRIARVSGRQPLSCAQAKSVVAEMRQGVAEAGDAAGAGGDEL
jgi:hypothetical protein